MNRVAAAGLGLILALYPVPASAQRTYAAQIARPADGEFLNLYREVNALEKKLENEPPETENRTWTEVKAKEDGTTNEQKIMSGPASIAEKILETKYIESNNIASRYEINFNPNETGIFTWGKYLVMDRFLDGYVIFDQFSAIVTKNSWGGEKPENYHYDYQTLHSVPTASGFDIVRGEDVADGYIPLFETNDFDGITSRIRDLVKIGSMRYLDDPQHVINEVPEFQGLNYDNTRAHFAHAQLTNIGMMLLKMIEDSPELNGLPVPGINMRKPLPRVGGNRIILYELTFGKDSDWKKADSKDPAERKAAWDDISYQLSLDGALTLSIGRDGYVNYFFQRQCCIEDQTPVTRTLKIKLPKSR